MICGIINSLNQIFCLNEEKLSKTKSKIRFVEFIVKNKIFLHKRYVC